MREHRYYVYIMASRSHSFYIGVTNNLGRRITQHKSHEFEGFTERYNIDRLVWFARYTDVRLAIAREKQLKGWRREKKIALIEAMNPTWQDLSDEWEKPLGLRQRTADPSTAAPKERASAQDDKQ